MILWKTIKPSKLRTEAMSNAILKELRGITKDIKKDFARPVRTWKHKVKFVEEFQIYTASPSGLGRVEIFIGSDDAIWRYVEEGTRPHVILPKNSPYLAFKGTYTAKTIPGVIDSRKGGGSGKTEFSQGVIHPGTQARHFSEAIAKLWRKRFTSRMEKAMRNAVKASGHAL